jgi:hypothetical protein
MIEVREAVIQLDDIQVRSAPAVGASRAFEAVDLLFGAQSGY